MLEFGQNQKIKVSKTSKGEKYNANILSMIKKNILITRPYIEITPYKFRYLDHLEPKNMLYISYDFDGKVYYFRTIVIKSSYTPFPHVILKAPEKHDIIIKNLRKAERFKTVLPLIVRDEREDFVSKHEEVFSLDISLTGIGILSKSVLTKTFNAEFYSGITNIKLKCNVLKAKKNFKGNFHFFGCEIVEVSNAEYFKKFLESLKIIMEAK